MARLFSCRILCSSQALLLSKTTLRNLNSASFSRTPMPEESELLCKVKEQVYRLNMPLNQAGQRRNKVTQTVAQIKFDVEEDETAVEETNAFNEAASLSINAGETEMAVEEEKRDEVEVASAPSSSNPQAEGEAIMRVDKTRDVAVHNASTSQQRKRGEASVRVLQTDINYHQKKSHHTCRVVVPKLLLGRVVGREQRKKKELEISTNSSIKILKNEVDEGTEIFEISAQLLEDVERCKKGLESAIDEAKEKSGPNHFISVPLEGFGSLVEEYVRLVERIQKEQDIPEECQRPELFMKKEKIHLTLSTLLLFTKEDEKRAIKHLDEMMQNEIPSMLSEAEGGSLEVKFPRLGFFGKLKKAKVLFADIECDRLVAIANQIDEQLYAAGLAEKRRPGDVKLHMTIGNIKYLHDRQIERRGLDLRKVMERFGETSLKSVKPSEVRICKMLTVDPVTKSYPVLHSVKFKSRSGAEK